MPGKNTAKSEETKQLPREPVIGSRSRQANPKASVPISKRTTFDNKPDSLIINREAKVYKHSSLNKTEFCRNDFKFGILFGCESSGLSNEDLITANQLIYIPSNSEFSSLNISHAVSLICWEFFKFFNDLILDQNSKISLNTSPTIKDMDYFYKNLCEKLNKSGFFHSDFMKKSIMENIKVLSNRAELSSQEIKTLNGIIKSLYEYNKQA